MRINVFATILKNLSAFVMWQLRRKVQTNSCLAALSVALIKPQCEICTVSQSTDQSERLTPASSETHFLDIKEIRHLQTRSVSCSVCLKLLEWLPDAFQAAFLQKWTQLWSETDWIIFTGSKLHACGFLFSFGWTFLLNTHSHYRPNLEAISTPPS